MANRAKNSWKKKISWTIRNSYVLKFSIVREDREALPAQKIKHYRDFFGYNWRVCQNRKLYFWQDPLKIIKY